MSNRAVLRRLTRASLGAINRAFEWRPRGACQPSGNHTEAAQQVREQPSLESIFEDHIIGYEFPPAAVVEADRRHVGAGRVDEYLIIQDGETAAEMVGTVGRTSEANPGFEPDRLAEESVFRKSRALPSWATVPLLSGQPTTNWSVYSSTPKAAPQWPPMVAGAPGKYSSSKL